MTTAAWAFLLDTHPNDAELDGPQYAADDVECLRQAGGHEASGDHEADERVFARGQNCKRTDYTGLLIL